MTFISTSCKSLAIVVLFALLCGHSYAQMKNAAGTPSQFSELRLVETATATTDSVKDGLSTALTYAYDTVCLSVIGSAGDITWGAQYPYTVFSGRVYLDTVWVYCREKGHFELSVYQTAPGAHPTAFDAVYRHTYAVSAIDGYMGLPIYDFVQLDDSKDLWVTFHCTDILLPAAATTFCGNPAGSYVDYFGVWTPVYAIHGAETLIYTWMIKTQTSQSMPPLSVAIVPPAKVITGDSVEFSVLGPAAATYEWVMTGAEVDTAWGATVRTLWAEPGEYPVTLTATFGRDTVVESVTVVVKPCYGYDLPFACGFEEDDSLTCWRLVDADADGFGWGSPAPYFSIPLAHTGDGCFGSASFINAIETLNPDNWLITPELAIPAEGATLKYYVGGIDPSYFREYYSVLVSTSGAGIENFTHEIYSGYLATADWVPMSFDLSAFAGQNIYIAFRHHNVTDEYWMLLDDIQVVAGNHVGVGEAADIRLALYPNPTTGILNVEADGVQDVSVVDVNGTVVAKAVGTNSVDLSGLADGVYFVCVVTAKGVATQKVVKKQ